MGKLRTLSGKEVCKVLEQYGFTQVRQKGSHIVMQKRTSETTITVPVPDHKQLKRVFEKGYARYNWPPRGSKNPEV